MIPLGIPLAKWVFKDFCKKIVTRWQDCFAAIESAGLRRSHIRDEAMGKEFPQVSERYAILGRRE
jgi:hypothetical protein